MPQLDTDTERVVQRFLQGIAPRYSMAGAIVYGSRARGTSRADSDVDVAVLLQGEPKPFLPIKLDMADTAFDLMLETGLLISPLPIWLEQWEQPQTYSNPALLQNIAREGIRV